MKSKYIKIILIVLIVATMAFIFSQSMQSRQKSNETSNAVGDIVAEVIPPETEVGGFIQINLRKLAHFVEFAVLGGEVSLFVILYMKRIKYMALSIPMASVIALIDESIQIFTGRGPSIIDVWIDTFGFFTASLIFYTVYALIVLIRRKCKQKL